MYVAAAFLAVLLLAGMAWTLTPSSRYFNTSGWGFTPSGGSITNITGVTSFAFDEGISTKKEGADYDHFPTVSVCDWCDPTITIETLDAPVLIAVLAGVKGTLAGVLRDAYNGAAAGGGGKTYTMSNAQIQTRNSTAAYREFAKQTLTFGAISSDGVTHPVLVAAL